MGRILSGRLVADEVLVYGPQLLPESSTQVASWAWALDAEEEDAAEALQASAKKRRMPCEGSAWGASRVHASGILALAARPAVISSQRSESRARQPAKERPSRALSATAGRPAGAKLMT